MNALRNVMPLVQRLLPLLEGNVLTAISNVLTPRPQAPPPPPKVDLAPLESSLAELQTQHRGLREQVMEQNASLKRVEDQLEMVREATDRNTLEQQELLEDLKIFSGKVKVVAVIGIGVLVIGFRKTQAAPLRKANRRATGASRPLPVLRLPGPAEKQHVAVRIANLEAAQAVVSVLERRAEVYAAAGQFGGKRIGVLNIDKRV
jgi:hypothetical protein